MGIHLALRKQLKEKREELGLTQPQMAERLGLLIDTYKRAEWAGNMSDRTVDIVRRFLELGEHEVKP